MCLQPRLVVLGVGQVGGAVWRQGRLLVLGRPLVVEGRRHLVVVGLVETFVGDAWEVFWWYV